MLCGRDAISLASERYRQSPTDLEHFLAAHGSDETPQLPLVDRKEVAEIDAGKLLQPLWRPQFNFGGRAAERRCDRRNRDGVEQRDQRGAAEDQHGATLVGTGQMEEPDLSAVQSSGHACEPKSASTSSSKLPASPE